MLPCVQHAFSGHPSASFTNHLRPFLLTFHLKFCPPQTLLLIFSSTSKPSQSRARWKGKGANGEGARCRIRHPIFRHWLPQGRGKGVGNPSTDFPPVAAAGAPESLTKREPSACGSREKGHMGGEASRHTFDLVRISTVSNPSEHLTGS